MSERPSDEIEERIDKRLSLLRDSIELKLTKEMDALLKSRFDTTGKIFGWAFGLVAIVFAGFGIKTFLDVREMARTTAVEEVKKKLAIDDPHSEFRRDIDKIVARGLIDSYLLSIAKHKQERFAPDLAISEADLRRLQNLIIDPSTSAKDFSDTLEVLLRSEQMGRNESMERLVQAIGSGAEKFRWISDQPDKRAALFRLYTGDKLVRIARDILGDEKTEKELLVAAVKYSGDRKDSQAADLLEGLTNHGDEDISLQALLALARIEPKSEALKLAINKAQNSNVEKDWVKSVRIAIEIVKHGSGFFDQDDPALAEERIRVSSVVLQEAVDHDYVFRLFSNFFGRSAICISLRRPLSSCYAQHATCRTRSDRAGRACLPLGRGARGKARTVVRTAARLAASR